MDTKKAQIRFELLTVARTASFTMVYLALQIWGFFSRKAIESTKKASDFVRCLKIRDRIIAPLYRLPYLLSELSSALGLGSIVSTKSTNSELESGVIISLKRFFISFEESLAALIKSI